MRTSPPDFAPKDGESITPHGSLPNPCTGVPFYKIECCFQ